MNRDWGFTWLLALGIAIPNGVANIFLPTILVSSTIDSDTVFLPVISLQVVLLLSYSLIHLRYFSMTHKTAAYFSATLLFSTIPAFFCLYPGGYLSYSLLWFIGPIAMIIFMNLSESSSVNNLEILTNLSLIFFPIYLFDLLVSFLNFGYENFASYMFATNGHSFVSFLFCLFLLITPEKWKGKVGLLSVYRIVCISGYFVGGVLSQGRVALIAFALSVAIITGRKIIILSILILPIAADFVLSNSKFQAVFEALIALDFDDTIAWSSAFSRLTFWEVFLNIFQSYPIAGAGGLAANIIKYDFGFPYNVFVDPHNEYIYILSGFGITGVLFLISALFMVTTGLNSIKKSHTMKNAMPGNVILYIVICSLTNANSAKQNIQLLIIAALSLLISSYMKKQVSN